MKIIKGMLLYHITRHKWCVVLQGGNSNIVKDNFNNKKVVSEEVSRYDLTKGYYEVQS